MGTKFTRIAPELIEACEAVKPSWISTTSFINEMISKGLASIDTDVTLKIPNENTHTDKKESEVFSNTNRVPNSINKEKNKKRFLFKKDLIPFDLELHAKHIEQFWKIKKGQKTEAAFNLLISSLVSLQKRYSDQVVTEQIDLAIAGGPNGPWSNITVKNYENFGKKRTNPYEESVTKHPSQAVFTAAKGFEQ